MISKKLVSKVMLGLMIAAPYTAFANSIGTVMVDGEQQSVNVNNDYSIGSNDAGIVQITSDSGYSLSISDLTMVL